MSLPSVKTAQARRRRIQLARLGLWLLFVALVGSAAAVPLLAVRHYREVLQYAYGGTKAAQNRTVPDGAATAKPVEPQGHGVLSIHTDPDHCATYLDEVYIGQSPLQIKGLPFGRHTIEVRRFPFSSARKTLQFARASQELSFDLEQRTGEIQLIGPGGALVLVDGESVGRLPMGPVKLPVGPHQVEVQGSVWWSKTIEVVESQRLSFDLATSSSAIVDSPPPVLPDDQQQYALDAGSATLLVNARPWGEVLFDGQKMGFSPLLLSNIPPGSHTLEIQRRGYRTESRVVHLKPGQRASVNVRLRKD